MEPEDKVAEPQTKECSVCSEQYLEEGEGDRCPLCIEYESIFDAAMNEVVDRTANRWRFTPSQLTIESRSITREEWEASGKKWAYPSWEEEFERLMNIVGLSQISCWANMRSLVVRMCDEKHGVTPFHAFKIVANVLRFDPKVCHQWESKVKYFLRTKQIKFCYRIRKFNWTEKYVARYYFEGVEKFIFPKFYDRKFVRQFDPWRHLISQHGSFASWLKSFALKSDYKLVKKHSTRSAPGKWGALEIEKRVRYDVIIQRLLTIEFTQGFKDFFKSDHPYAIEIQTRRKEEAEAKRIKREERVAAHEAKLAEKREHQREQQAAYRERKKILKAAQKRAEEYLLGKILNANPMEEWPEVDE